MSISEYDPELREVMAYLRQHRAEVSIEALRGRLIAAGHPEALVDEAIRRLQPTGPASADSVWMVGLGLLVLDVVVFWAMVLSNSPWPLALLMAQLLVGLGLLDGPRQEVGRGAILSLGLFIALSPVLVGICMMTVGFSH